MTLPIKVATLGPLCTNCYFFLLPKRTLVVDPGAEPEIISKMLKDLGHDKSFDILLTHGHFDHVSAVPSLVEHNKNSRIFVSKKELPLLTNPEKNLSKTYGEPITLQPYESQMSFVDEQHPLDFDKVPIKVLDVPGHTPGHVAYYIPSEKVVFSGDTLFEGSIGITHTKEEARELIESIRTKLLSLPKDTLICPGHGNCTNVEREKLLNPFLQIFKPQKVVYSSSFFFSSAVSSPLFSSVFGFVSGTSSVMFIVRKSDFRLDDSAYIQL